MMTSVKRKFFCGFMMTLYVVLMCNCDSLQNDTSVHQKPNIVLMFTDELQFSDIRTYGGRIPTPEIDKLAGQGVKFSKAYTPASMCTPSRFAVLTGMYPGRCMAATFLSSNPTDQPYNIAWNTWITPDLTTMPRILRENGYTTGMSGKWHVGHLNKTSDFPSLSDADDLDDPLVEMKLRKRQVIYEEQIKQDAGFDYAASVIWGNFDGHPVKSLQFHNFPWISRGALEFLDQQRENSNPFFLYVTPTAIHGPNHVADLDKDKTYTPEGRKPDVLKYNLDEEQLRRAISSLPSGVKHRYAGISNIDYQLGLIRKKLKEIGKEDNTIIIFMSDHNIEPGKATSYEKGINIPMIVYWPGVTQGAESSSLISSVDVLPTVLDLIGSPAPENSNLDGQSFLSVLKNPASKSRKYVFSENGYSRSISDGRYKYIALRYPTPLVHAMECDEIAYAPSYVGNWPQAHSAIAMKCFPSYFDQNQLYDLETDPYEQSNIYLEQIQKSNELKNVLKAHLETFRHPFSLDDIEFLNAEAYKKKYAVNLEYDLANISWLHRDHGTFNWPPKN